MKWWSELAFGYYSFTRNGSDQEQCTAEEEVLQQVLNVQETVYSNENETFVSECGAREWLGKRTVIVTYSIWLIQLEKWPFKKPSKDDDAAVFNQYFLSHQQRALIIYQCNKCNLKALKYDKQKLIDGTLTLCLPLCPSCVLANRRANQSVFFNISLKNIHDRVKEASAQNASAKKAGARKREDEPNDSDEDESEMSESEVKENLPSYEEEEEEEE